MTDACWNTSPWPFALDQGGFLDRLIFQRGTALRLCHGALRFSEDLDFVGGRHFSADALTGMANCIHDFVARRYGLEVKVRQLRSDRPADRNTIAVHRWRINVVTATARSDLPQQKIRIEVVNVPAYTADPMALLRELCIPGIRVKRTLQFRKPRDISF